MMQYTSTSNARYGASKGFVFDSSLSSFFGNHKQSATKPFGTHFPNYEDKYHRRFIVLDTKDLGIRLQEPILCNLSIKGENTFLTNKELDITSVGEDLENAIASFSDELSYLYQRLNEFEDDRLSRKLQKAKKQINKIIKSGC